MLAVADVRHQVRRPRPGEAAGEPRPGRHRERRPAAVRVVLPVQRRVRPARPRPDELDAGDVGFGTTNVDINPPLRAALASVLAATCCACRSAPTPCASPPWTRPRGAQGAAARPLAARLRRDPAAGQGHRAGAGAARPRDRHVPRRAAADLERSRAGAAPHARAGRHPRRPPRPGRLAAAARLTASRVGPPHRTVRDADDGLVVTQGHHRLALRGARGRAHPAADAGGLPRVLRRGQPAGAAHPPRCRVGGPVPAHPPRVGAPGRPRRARRGLGTRTVPGRRRPRLAVGLGAAGLRHHGRRLVPPGAPGGLRPDRARQPAAAIGPQDHRHRARRRRLADARPAMGGGPTVRHVRHDGDRWVCTCPWEEEHHGTRGPASRPRGHARGPAAQGRRRDLRQRVRGRLAVLPEPCVDLHRPGAAPDRRADQHAERLRAADRRLRGVRAVRQPREVLQRRAAGPATRPASSAST